MSRKVKFSLHQGLPVAFLREKATQALWVVVPAYAFEVHAGSEYDVCLAPSWNSRARVFGNDTARVCYASPAEWQTQCRLNSVEGIITNESWEQSTAVLSEAKSILQGLAIRLDSPDLFPVVDIIEG